MKIVFTHHGQQRTLVKHPKIAHAVRHGLMTEADAAWKPWYLRLIVGDHERSFKLSATAKETAVREARDILNSRQKQPNEFKEWLNSRELNRGITVRQLAVEWFKVGCPFSKTKPREMQAAFKVQTILERALPWWCDKVLTAVKPTHHEDYVVWRRQHVKSPFTGSRSADLELAALSSLCQWGIASGRLAINPFAARQHYQNTAEVHHCHEFAPRSDDDFHAVLAYLWQNPNDISTVIAGAWLCFTGLVGLRPEEPAALFRVARLTKPPANPKGLTFGSVFPTHDGSLRMRVCRNKHGQNPFVVLHSPAITFLQIWSAWLAEHCPTADRLFPGIETVDTTLLNRRLRSACTALKLAQLRPKGFGRAYYVRCRRSAGIDDGQISMELGQTTNGKLIRNTYGDPEDLFGSGFFDWLPTAGEPAWNLLRRVPVVLLAEGHVQDTSGTPQDRVKKAYDSDWEKATNLGLRDVCRTAEVSQMSGDATKSFTNSRT